MKKKTGFTLAEVLITLAIIGIIAALVLPAVLNNFQFRAVGTRLSKFMTTVENSTRAYVETEEAIAPDDTDNINDYVRRTFSITEIADGGPKDAESGLFDITKNNWNTQINAIGGALDTALKTNDSNQPDSPHIILKDGTRMDIYPLTINATRDEFPKGSPVPGPDAIGRPALGILFSPSANALPGSVRRTFGFVVTELGFVFPAPSDVCTWRLYAGRWQTRPENFAADTACGDKASLGDGHWPEGWSAGPRTGEDNNNNNNGG